MVTLLSLKGPDEAMRYPWLGLHPGARGCPFWNTVVLIDVQRHRAYCARQP